MKKTKTMDFTDGKSWDDWRGGSPVPRNKEGIRLPWPEAIPFSKQQTKKDKR